MNFTPLKHDVNSVDWAAKLKLKQTQQYFTVILYLDSKDPDQTVHVHSLIWDFAVYINWKHIFSLHGSCVYDPQRKKRYPLTWAPKEDSDKPMHLHSLISLNWLHKETLHPWLSRMCLLKCDPTARMTSWSENLLIVFDPVTPNTPIRAQSSIFIVFRLHHVSTSLLKHMLFVPTTYRGLSARLL